MFWMRVFCLCISCFLLFSGLLLTLRDGDSAASAAQNSNSNLPILFLFSGILIFLYGSITRFKRENSAVGAVKVGLINSNAVNLVQPVYPSAARAANPQGAVEIQVLIGKNGEVLRAAPVSGHPLLQKAALAAALKSRFAPPKIKNRPVKINGTLRYEFFNRLSVLQIGFALAADDLHEFPATAIADVLSNEWSETQAILSQIKILQENKKNAGTEFASLCAKLNELLEDAFAGEELRSWSFALGKILGEISRRSNDATALRERLQQLKNFTSQTPPQLAPDFVLQLKAMSDLAENETLSHSDLLRLQSFLTQIR
jgi:TonB family protein